ncbi:hypothetical protein PENTCL1PPCAC_11946 [Pristionchus entomophagus]|uniref:HAT C-terminal dimerisation domain-containing protein n=1 Tax=Pristionchus entomophagus TaxID=358040 RepID=A0AAV5T2G5_9BILA|nr:hypothetical protein PENTCL1PPCAC_11946 [Pristionchus entomophagus]
MDSLFRDITPKLESPDDEKWDVSQETSSSTDGSFPWDPSFPRIIVPEPSTSPSTLRRKVTKPRARSNKNRSHFLRFFAEIPSDPTKMRCVLCPNPTEIRYLYGTKKVTSSMRDHLLAYHPTELKELLEGEARQDQASRHLLRAVATGVLPFSSVQNEEFRLFSRCLDPSFPVPEYEVLLGSVLQAEFDATHTAVLQVVLNQDISLTVNEWKRGEESIEGTTSHLIDAQWNRHVLVVYMDSTDEEKQMKEFLHALHQHLGFRSITASISDCETESSSEERSEEPPSLGCVLRACHHLVTDSLFAFSQGREIIERIRRVAVHLNRSSKSWKELKKKLVVNACSERRRLPVDRQEDWGYLMRMLRVADAQMAFLDDVFQQAGVSPLSSSERTLLQRLVAFLEDIDDFAAKMSTHQSTLSSLIPYIKGLEETIGELRIGPLSNYYPFILEQFNRRLAVYREYSVVRMAYLLDPRFLHLACMLDDVTLTGDLAMLFQQADEESATTSAVCEPSVKKSRSNLLAKAVPQSPIRPPSHAKREYDVLHDLSHSSDLPEDADPCVFWKEHEAKFPRLAPIARRLLAIPPSSINSERFFLAIGVKSAFKIPSDIMTKLIFVGAFLKRDRLRFRNTEEYNDFFSDQQVNDN